MNHTAPYSQYLDGDRKALPPPSGVEFISAAARSLAHLAERPRRHEDLIEFWMKHERVGYTPSAPGPPEHDPATLCFASTTGDEI
jgi:hypothetical protein